MTFLLSLSESAGSRSLHRLFGLWDASSPRANNEIVLIMPPNPKPDQIVPILNRNGSKMNADTY